MLIINDLEQIRRKEVAWNVKKQRVEGLGKM